MIGTVGRRALLPAATRPRATRIARRALLALLLAAALPSAARAASPRPLRLLDLNPRTLLSIGTEWGRIDDDSHLAFPIELGIQLAPEVVFRVEGPFGYVAAPGQATEPLLGNIGLGVTASRTQRLGYKQNLLYGFGLMGRVPTSAGLDSTARSAQVASLRAISVFHSSRWSPETAAVRVDFSLQADLEPFVVGLQVGGTGALPMYSDPATLQLHYGVSGGARAFRGLWVMVDVVGATAAPGRPGQGGDHMLTVAPGLRFETLRFSPAVWVSIPILGDFDGASPVVIGAEIASW